MNFISNYASWNDVADTDVFIVWCSQILWESEWMWVSIMTTMWPPSYTQTWRVICDVSLENANISAFDTEYYLSHAWKNGHFPFLDCLNAGHYEMD